MTRPPVGQFLGLVVLTALVIVGAKYFTPPSQPQKDNVADLPTQATITTDRGTIAINLFPKDAPKTVENFRDLAGREYYNGLIFHRVIPGFMIQTGDPSGTGTGGESVFGGEFPDEINQHKIVVGSVAMANRGPNTNTSQFFIVTESAQPALDGRHTVFGQVTTGLDVARAISGVPRDANDKPLEAVKMLSVTTQP